MLAKDGRWVIYGVLGGSLVRSVKFGDLKAKRGSILTSNLRDRSDEYKANLIDKFSRECIDDLNSGKMYPVIDRVFKMSDIRKAH